MICPSVAITGSNVIFKGWGLPKCDLDTEAPHWEGINLGLWSWISSKKMRAQNLPHWAPFCTYSSYYDAIYNEVLTRANR